MIMRQFPHLPPGEATIAKWFATTGRRSEIFLATKWGSMDLTPGAANMYQPNSKPSYIKRQLESSLKTLGTDSIDLYYQHRVDPQVPIEGTAFRDVFHVLSVVLIVSYSRDGDVAALCGKREGQVHRPQRVRDRRLEAREERPRSRGEAGRVSDGI